MKELYHPVQIGSLTVPGNLFLAPVAGYSDRAFRFICKQNGADMCYTEMVSSEALWRGSDKTSSLLLKSPNDPIFAVQIFGGNENSMYQGTKIVLEKYTPSLIDINCGCPVPKIIKSGSGSELTRKPEKLYSVAKQVVRAAKEIAESQGNNAKPVPITVKIRSGWDANNLTWKEAAQAAVEAGCSAVTIHARTRAQGYEGKADWDILAKLVKEFPCIPIFGSGDVFTPEDAKRMLETTNCAGVMFARGAMGNPFIFDFTKQLLTKGCYEQICEEKRIKAGLEELKILIQDKGEELACREMRKRFCCYTKGLTNGSQLRTKIVLAKTEQDYINLYDSFVHDKLE
ncbi:MAG: tRNA dihydrouridine synthase DusB [Treponemataceae bacterium]